MCMDHSVVCKCGKRDASFNFKNEVWIWHGDRADRIIFDDIIVRDEFFNKLVEAKSSWNRKYSALL